MARVGVGIDVSKGWLDVATTALATPWRVPNSAAGWRQLIAQLGEMDVHRVVLEALVAGIDS